MGETVLLVREAEKNFALDELLAWLYFRSWPSCARQPSYLTALQ